MQDCENRRRKQSGQIFPFKFKRHQAQTGRGGENEENGGVSRTAVISSPHRIIAGEKGKRSRRKGRNETGFPSAPHGEYEQSNGNRLKDRRRRIECIRPAFSAQNVVRRRDTEPQNVRKHDEREQQKPPCVKSEPIFPEKLFHCRIRRSPLQTALRRRGQDRLSSLPRPQTRRECSALRRGRTRTRPLQCRRAW